MALARATLILLVFLFMLGCGGEAATVPTPTATTTSPPTPTATTTSPPTPAPTAAMSSYPKLITDGFIEGCIASAVGRASGVGREACECGIAWFEDNVPFDDFLTYGPNSDQGREWLESSQEACGAG